MPPVRPTFLNVATHAWKLIQKLNNTFAGTDLPAFLGQTPTDIISRHFPNNWLNHIKIHVRTPVPTPNLNELRVSLGYADLHALQVACAAVHPNLYNVLMAFSAGAGFNGIAYDNTIYLATAKSDELALVVHELVHTVQWDVYSPISFLNKYIQGFANNIHQYKENPAERRAYGFENQFRSQVSSLGAFAAGAATVSIWRKPVANTPPMQVARTQLTSMPPLNITSATATQGM